MRNRGLYMLVASGAVGSAALGWGLFANQAEANQTVAAPPAPVVQVSKVKIVVASTSILQGESVSLSNLTLADWPKDDVPYGAFRSLSALAGDSDSSRQALTDIQAGKPILASRLSVPGGQSALAARLKPGMRAISIRTDDVSSVAGFVLPGARVDVLHTFEDDRENVTTRVLLQDVEVLAIDRNDNVLSEEPELAKTATLSVNLEQAKALSMAAQDGRLSLALVGSSEVKERPDADAKLVSPTLTTAQVRRPAITRKARSVVQPVQATGRATSNVKVILGDDVEEQSVPESTL